MSAPIREIRYRLPQDIDKAFEELLLAAMACREAQNKFDAEFGAQNRIQKRRRQQKLDFIINKHLSNPGDYLPPTV